MAMDFNKKMKDVIGDLQEKRSVLLHFCCAPCSTSVIEKLSPYFNITVFYYNPNIFPQKEYDRRKNEQKTFLDSKNISFIEGDYRPTDFANAIKGFESFPEKSQRCKECYRFRLTKTAGVAKEQEFDFFTTTLTVSPHKNAEWINEIMQKLEMDCGVRYLPSDFKKEGGYLRSVEISKELGLRRQDYCGCSPKAN